MATTGEGDASGGSVATAGGGDEGNGGDNGSSEPLRRWKKSKNKGRTARRRHAAKGR